jgi:hypothetical protein
LRVGPYAEFSVDEPMANSSMFVLPIVRSPRPAQRSVTVASYTGLNPSRIFEPAVVGTPLVLMTSLRAIGMPSPGDASHTWRKQFSSPSRSSMAAR